MKYYLPARVPGYLQRLHIQYSRDGKNSLRDLIAASRSSVIEETDSSSWDGGTYGHDVQLFIPIEVLSKINISEQGTVAESICEDLNKLGQSTPNEFFRAVRLEVNHENDPDLQRANPVLSGPAPGPTYDPDSLPIWKPGMVRLFISHRDIYKSQANELAHALEQYGISSFVAHDTIEPMTQWQAEIRKGLETMEIMLAFVTDDFHESVWTNQEIGFALARNIPIISLKLQQSDPKGFIGDQQALKGSLDDSAASFQSIYDLLAERLGNRERLQSGLISAFVEAQSFSEAIKRFDRMAEVVNRLSEDEVKRIIDGFAANNQLYNCDYLCNSKNKRLCNFLERTTSESFSIEGTRIIATPF